jgi:uracil-DNA glycosylase family 4
MTMSLVLDPRQRAMLAEMGVRVWLPVRAELVQADRGQIPNLGQAQVEREAVAIPVRREPLLRLPVLTSPPTVSGAPVRYVIGNLPADMATFDIVILGEPCTGDAQKLLDNMTRVLGDKFYVAEMVPYQNESASLADQLANFPAKVILALGPHSAKALLGEALQATPFGKLRGTAHSAEGIRGKVVVTYHPLQLLRQPLAKAQAWSDLKLVMEVTK